MEADAAGPSADGGENLMHTVTLSKPIDTPRWKLDAGTWLCEDLSAFELAIDADRGTSLVQPFWKPSALYPQRTLVIANGGYGDMIMWTPAMREFKAKWPKHRLILATRQRMHCVFYYLGYMPELWDYPVNIKRLEGVDRVLTSEHIQESSEDGKNIPAIDLKARLLGVGPLVGDQRKMSYKVSMQEAELAYATYTRTRRKRVGIQLVASSPTRTYHKQHMTAVMTALYDNGYEIFLFGAPGSLPLDAIPESKRDLIRNLAVDKLSFRESAAVAQTCDCLFVPDSSLMHVAEALQIPAVAIFGSTHWSKRISGEGSVIAIQGNAPCSPCWHHPKGHQIFVPGQTCEKMGYCGPLNMISPEQVVAAIERQLEKYAK